MDGAWVDRVQAIFPEQYVRIAKAVQTHPAPQELAQLFAELAARQQGVEAPSNTKKRKLDNGTATHTNGTVPAAITSATTTFECADVSCQIPARKKLKLQFVQDANEYQRKEVRLVNPTSNEVEHVLPGANIDQAFCLPVPEKATRQYNFVLFPKGDATTSDGTPSEQVVFTLNETAPKGAWSVDKRFTEDDTLITVTRADMDALLRQYGKHVVVPDEAEFASSIVQSHRKSEKAYHVKAHRGSKDGFLFFLENGIVFGFKKPLAFFPFSSIESISYTSVLQRTFNLVIGGRENDDAEVKEVEFSMIDQADFAGIDEYVKRHGLNDASMAADRRAKAYNVNKVKKEETNGDGGAADDEDGQTELQKAEQMLQDQEDEEEEDYEASGGESDGEGEDSDDEEGEGYADTGDQEAVDDEVEYEEDEV